MKAKSLKGISPDEISNGLVESMADGFTAFFPIIMLRDGAAVIRASMFSNPKVRSIMFGGSVPQGTKFQFSLPPDFDVVDKVLQECDENMEYAHGGIFQLWRDGQIFKR